MATNTPKLSLPNPVGTDYFNRAAYNALVTAIDNNAVGIAQKNAANGVATLDGSKLIPLAQIPATLTGKDADTIDGKHATDFVQITNGGKDVNLGTKKLMFNAGVNTGTEGIGSTDYGEIFGEHDLDTELSRLVFRIGDNASGQDAFVFRTVNSTTIKDTLKIMQNRIDADTDIYVSGNKVMHLGNDGTGSGFDADLLDGRHGSDYSLSTHLHDDRYVKKDGNVADRVIITNSSGSFVESAITVAELGYLDNATSNIQTQLNAKLASASYTAADVYAKFKSANTEFAQLANATFKALAIDADSLNILLPQTGSTWARGVHFKDSTGAVTAGSGFLGAALNNPDYFYAGFGVNPWDTGNGLTVKKDGNHSMVGKLNVTTSISEAGTLLSAKYAPIGTNITAGTGITGGGTLAANRTISFDTTWGDGRYVTKSGATMTGQLSIDTGSSQPIKLIAGTADHVYISLYARATDKNLRTAYMGFGSAASTTLTIANEIAGGNVNLTTSGGGVAAVNGSKILTESMEGSGNGLDVDTVDGKHASDFASSGHNHDSVYARLGAVNTFTAVSSMPGLNLVGVNAALELGPSGQANTPLIDFRSGAGTTDYDVRLIASGGSTGTTVGQGTLDIYATNVNIRSTLSTTGAITEAGTNLASKYAPIGTSITAGAGLTGGGQINATRSLAVNFAGSGSATTVARSDHNHDAKYAFLTGDKFTGKVTLSDTALRIEKSHAAGTYGRDVLQAYGADAYGLTLVMEGGGPVIVGAGEGPMAVVAPNISSSSETTYITADAEVKLISNTNTDWASRKEVILETSGRLRTNSIWIQNYTDSDAVLNFPATASVTIDAFGNVRGPKMAGKDIMYSINDGAGRQKFATAMGNDGNAANVYGTYGGGMHNFYVDGSWAIGIFRNGTSSGMHFDGGPILKYQRNMGRFETRTWDDGAFADFAAAVMWSAEYRTHSTREIKKNIELFEGDALDIVNSTPVFDFHLNTQEDTERKKRGMVVEESHPDIVSDDGKSVNMYTIDAVLWKAVQELSDKVKELEKLLGK